MLELDLRSRVEVGFQIDHQGQKSIWKSGNGSRVDIKSQFECWILSQKLGSSPDLKVYLKSDCVSGSDPK